MSEWKRLEIGQFLKERDGRYDPKDESVLGLKRLNKIDFSGEIHLSDKDSKTDMIVVEPGDFVISGINVSKGALAVYHGEKPITATIHYSSYVFDEKQIDIEYFKRFVRSQSFIQALKDQVKGGIKTEIKPKHFLPLEIDLPDIGIQKDIVSFFKRVEGDMDELGSEISSQIEYLNKFRQGVLQEAIEGKLTTEWRKQNPALISGENHASKLLEKIKAEKEWLIKEGKVKKDKPLPPIADSEKPFALPDSWVWCRLGEIADGFQYGSSAKSSKSGKVPVLRMGNLQNGSIEWNNLVYTSNNDEISKYSLRSDDLLFNRTNSRELVGKTAIFTGGNAIYAGYLVRFHMADESDAYFTNYVMNSAYHRDWCDTVKTDALGQSNINATKLRSYVFPLAPIKEQNAIVARVDKLMAVIGELEKQVYERKDQAEMLMQSVLREAFEN
jgi:type I restriction enzyme S subunit